MAAQYGRDHSGEVIDIASDLAAFARYLGHSNIAIKSVETGKKGAQEKHFKTIKINRAEDHITLRNGKRQIYLNLQKLKPEVGEYITFSDIEGYKNVYIDLDCDKPKDMKDFAATEEERVKALSQIHILREWLDLHRFNCGLELSTGNGAGMVLPIPETKAEPVFIAKLATFLKVVKADISNTDTAMFDPPRVIGIPGTINAKLETEGRKNRVREVVGAILERIEDQALLNYINSLEPDPSALKEWNKKYGELQTAPEADKGEIDADDILDRITGIMEADPKLKSLLDGHIEAHGTDRSRAEYGVCGKLIKYGFSDPEIDYIMCHVSKIGKWQEEGPHYRFDQTLRKLREAEAGNKEEQKPEGPTLEKALLFIAGRCDGAASTDGQGFNKQDTIFGKAIATKVRSGQALRVDEYKSIHKMLGKYNTQLVEGEMDIRLIPKEPPEPNEEPTKEPEFAADILAEANRILDEGKGFEYAYEVWQKRHHGDENLGKGLFLSIGAQSCESSKGVHIHACGPRGTGKSDGSEKATEEIPESHLLVGSASPKALYYLGERLPAGAVVYLDDIGWNDQAAQMFKTCTTFYREGATHTVVVDQEIRQFKTAPRIIFWLTKADDQTDEQIRDRLLRIDTTETPTHTKEVTDFIFQQRKSGASSFDSREIEVCRAIIYLLKQVFIDVVIPFSDKIEFEGDPRGATIFADLVSAFAVWRYRKRARDNNGAVIACYEDYKDAETFFNAIKGHGDTKYTPGELRVLQAIKDLHGEATREMVMAKTGMSKGGLADVLNGRSRDGQAKYGLLHKCPALTEDEESTQKRIDEDTKTSKRKKVYRLPEDYDIMKAYGKAVYLSDETVTKRTCSSSSLRFAGSSQVKNDFGKDIVRKFVEYNNIRERSVNNPKHKLSPMDEEISSSFSQGAKSSEPANLEPIDGDLPQRTETRTQANLTLTNPNDNDSKPANHSESVCAVCGADLAGKGQVVEKNGKHFCARPGCGYPTREASA